jgi:hypothetical protein
MVPISPEGALSVPQPVIKAKANSRVVHNLKRAAITFLLNGRKNSLQILPIRAAGRISL